MQIHIDQFPSLFQGIGNLGEPYYIQLKADAKPYALFTTRNVPLPLRTKDFQEIKFQKLIYLHNGVLEWWWFPKRIGLCVFPWI